MLQTYAKSLRMVWGGVIVLLGLIIAAPVFGNTITVTSTADSGPGSLRDAIATASNGDTINFSLTYPATITVSTPLTLGPNVTIIGPGASSLAISGDFSVGVFIINAGATVAISGVTIKLGASVLGGGIFNAGTLTLSDSAVLNNFGQLGAGIFNSNTGTLTLSKTTVSLNSVDLVTNAGGGGIYNFEGTVTLSESTVSNNGVGATEVADGGGILNDDGLVTVTDSTVSSNVALNEADGDARGGGISNINSGSLIVSNSTVSGNSVYSFPGSGSLSGGGGISNGFPLGHGSVKLTNSTVTGNSVTGAGGGGGIRNAGVATVVNTTIAGNSLIPVLNVVGGAGVGGGLKNQRTL
jgi:hypothetical protein